MKRKLRNKKRTKTLKSLKNRSNPLIKNYPNKTTIIEKDLVEDEEGNVTHTETKVT